MPTLKYCRLRGDMIETFKIVNGIYDKDVTERFVEIKPADIVKKYKKETAYRI
jgi:hypothetical protein